MKKYYVNNRNDFTALRKLKGFTIRELEEKTGIANRTINITDYIPDMPPSEL